jgi:RNA polymerase sigma-70 factor (ECF subfamily)
MTAIEFSHQVAALGPELRVLTHRFTRDAEECSDLVQDTLLKALTYRDKFRDNTNLKGWLYTIMRNTFINNYRRNKSSRTRRDNSGDLHHLNVADRHTFSKPDATTEYSDTWNQVEALRDELKAPFKMYTTGYKYHEIAELLSIPIGTVKNRIFHARKEIQARLAGYR